MRVAILYDPAAQPELPALPADDQVRVTALVALGPDFELRLADASPDLIVVDLRVRALGTTEIILRIRSIAPQASLLVVGQPGALIAARDAIRGGVAGYVTVDASRVGLMRALHTIAGGGVFVSRNSRPAVSLSTAIESP